MSDDIDIEEHDVMDNPTIKRIFPDLSVIKKEISQYFDEEVLPTTTEPTTGYQVPTTTFQENKRIKKESDSNINTDLRDNTPSTIIVSENGHNYPEENKFLENNIIILGSKPSVMRKNKLLIKKKQPKVVLKNVCNFLNTCNRYCKDCFILFPKADLFENHMNFVHCCNETSDSQLQRSDWTLYGKKVSKGYKCYSCNMICSTTYILIKHYNTVHTLATMKANNSRKTKNTKSSDNSCFHCKKVFLSQNSLIEHLYDVLTPKTIKQKKITTNLTKEKGKNTGEDKNNLTSQSLVSDGQDHTASQALVDIKDMDLDRNDIKKAAMNGMPDGHAMKQNEKFLDITSTISNKNSRENCVSKKLIKVRKQSQSSDINSRTRSNTHECNECMRKFGSVRQLTCHNIAVHKRDKIHDKNEENVDNGCVTETTEDYQKMKQELVEKLYQCLICFRYIQSFKYYTTHMFTKHNVKVDKAKKVLFDPQCKLCENISPNVKTYNSHLWLYHMKPSKQKKQINFSLKSVLYECIKCHIFFLSANEAMDHGGHKELIADWKCSVCERLFKKKDETLHLQQHSVSNKFFTYKLSGPALGRVLYKCAKCAVHFGESEYLIHYTKCELEPPNSLYCKVCDILINSLDMDAHLFDHEQKKMQSFDFTIIEADIIFETPEKNKNKDMKSKSLTDKIVYLENEGSHHHSKFVMTFCDKCKCFISNIHPRKVHIEMRCGHMIKYVCKLCGLVLTAKAYSTHNNIHHRDIKHLGLQHYFFYDLRTRKRIRPPIPEYPNCKNCGIHFLSKNAIRTHECVKQEFTVCEICQIKLTKKAYTLHMAFHDYKLRKNKNRKFRETEIVSNPNNESLTDEIKCTVISNDVQSKFVYTCKSCQISFDAYDKVIHHCQDHYDPKGININVVKCQLCNLSFEKDCSNHEKIHLLKNNGEDYDKMIEFDPFYFRYSNDFWIKHIFAYVSDEQIKQILDVSVYKHEGRLKMEAYKSGRPSLTLYKCDKCQGYIDTSSLYMHAENSNIKSCKRLRKYPCPVCGFCFVSPLSRSSHEKVHSDPNIIVSSFRIVIYNKENDQIFHKAMFDSRKQFILYQCRICQGVVDKCQRGIHKCDAINLKKCLNCGLFFHKQDYDLHFIRHEELDNFNANSISVIMFGTTTSLSANEEAAPYFNGTVYDYTFYKCKICELCFDTKPAISDHICVFNDFKCQCSICGLYFLKTALTQSHLKLHETGLEFEEYNINIINFEAVVKDSTSTIPCIESNDKVNENPNKNINDRMEMVETIYKCNCGLHFVEEENAGQHVNNCNPRMKISKQCCSKCELLFTPGELFNHLLKHHSDKKIQYTFNIIIKSKNQASQ